MLRRMAIGVVMASFFVAAIPAWAQTDEGAIEILSPYPGLVVEAGDTATFPIQATGAVGARAALQTSGLPSGWEATFRSDGSTIDGVAITSEGTPQAIELEVTVPTDASEGSYDFTASAGTSLLPLSVTVRAGVAGEVTLTPDFLGLRGQVDSEFSFSVTLRNDTVSEVEVELDTTGPTGWLVTAEPSGQSQALVVSVGASQSTVIDLTAIPAFGAEAGTYEIGMTAIGEGVETELAVIVELVGDLSVAISTPDQRLNAEVTIGQATEFPILVLNDGTAPLLGVTLSSRAPTGWEVTIDPEQVQALAPGESTIITALITPSANALAGDYDLSFTATAETVSDSMSVRTAVSPSALWGLIGIGLIALTLAGLAGVFRRYGRR